MKGKFIIGGLLIFILGVGGVFYQLFMPMSFGSQKVVVTIKSGEGPSQIADILKTHDLIRSRSVFLLYTRLRGFDRKLKAGYFHLNRYSSLARIAQQLSHKSAGVSLTRVTIPEGFSLKDISELLEEKGLISDRHAFMTFSKTKAKHKFIKKFKFLELVPTSNLEGYYFPDTYFFAKGVSMTILIETFLKRFESIIMKIWNNAPQGYDSPKSRFNFHNIVTMASMIEKEAAVQSEMPLISSVFYNRLKKYMKLASDPTVIYALGQPKKEVVYYKDLKVDSPYNTYKYSGFPPTPIASPGLMALKAALNPSESPYLFFVSNRDGTHSFTKTYEAHLSAQNKIKLNGGM